MNSSGFLRGVHLSHLPLASRLGPSPFSAGNFSFSLPTHILCLIHPSDLDGKVHFLPEVSLTPDQVRGLVMDLQGPHTPLAEHPAPKQHFSTQIPPQK